MTKLEIGKTKPTFIRSVLKVILGGPRPAFFETTISDTKTSAADQKTWSHKKTYKTDFV